MTKQAENLITKGLALIFASLLSITGWLAKSEITSMAETLKDIRTDVSKLNTKSLLQAQEYKFKFEWFQKKITAIDKKLLELEKK